VREGSEAKRGPVAVPDAGAATVGGGKAVMSPEMSERVVEYLKASLKRRQGHHWMKDPLHVFLMAFLADASDDATASNIMRMADDWRARGDRSALARVLGGEVDIVSLVDGGEHA
jgi:hypothetical protein